MQIIVRNSASIPNKYIRLLKWKMYRLQRRCNKLHYVEIFVKREGNHNRLYSTILRLGVPGNDIIIRNQNRSPVNLIATTHKDAKRQLSKWNKEYKYSR